MKTSHQHLKNAFRYFCAAALLCYPVSSMAQRDTAQNSFNLQMEFVTHGEACGGGLPKADPGSYVESKSDFLFGRTRITAEYARPGLEARAVLQNKAVWGSSGNQAVNLYEGWVKLKAKNGLFAQIGRIALSYDDERIIGTNDFATAALSHDALRLGYEGHGHQLHVILAYNQNADSVYTNTYYTDGAEDYKTMQTVWYHYDVPEFPLGASLLFMNIGMQAGVPGSASNPPTTKYQQMYGGYLNFHPEFLTLEGSYYRQSGKIVNTKMEFKPIKAWMASVKATIKPAKKYEFELGYDYLSGDDYVPVIHGGMMGLPLLAVEGGFTPLYGSRSKFYGILDYYYESAYINGFTPGLQNTFAGVHFIPNDRLTVRAVYHYLATATQLRGLDRTLGHSVELQAHYDFTKDISLDAGYTQMVGTETMDRLRQGNTNKYARWAWFTLAVKPSLFTKKW